MLSRIQPLGSFLVVLTLLLFAGSAGAQDVTPRCEAAMDRAAGDYSRCLLRADAHYARHENATKLENRQARCEMHFDRRTSRAINRHGADECTSTDLVAALADRTVSCAEGVSIEAGGEAAASLLYVQNATGGTLTESTLTLTGVSLQTGWFTNRPYRHAGRMTTAEFVALFSEGGANSFADDPPEADFTCESGGEAVNQVVMLTESVLDEVTDTLTYTAVLVSSAGDDDPFEGITCDGDAHLFVDSNTATGAAHCRTDANCPGDGNYCKIDPTKTPPYYCKNAVAQVCSSPAELAAAESKICTDTGGTWDAGTSTCTPARSYTPAELAAAQSRVCTETRGTWDAGTSTCTPARSYDCWVGGFCSKAHTYVQGVPDSYTNVYAGDTTRKNPALAAGCNESPGSALWNDGSYALEEYFFNQLHWDQTHDLLQLSPCASR